MGMIVPVLLVLGGTWALYRGTPLTGVLVFLACFVAALVYSVGYAVGAL